MQFTTGILAGAKFAFQRFDSVMNESADENLIGNQCWINGKNTLSAPLFAQLLVSLTSDPSFHKEKLKKYMQNHLNMVKHLFIYSVNYHTLLELQIVKKM